MEKINFSAGPAILPASVIAEASAGAANLNGSGLSVMEISHRSPAFTEILEEAVSLVQELLELPDGYKVLFLSGGASTQFFMAPLNLLNEGQKAAYLDTGSWSAKAIKEARLYGDIEVAASSKADQYTHIPKTYKLPTDIRYLHITSNNTIYGTQYHDLPESPAPLVADMSSDMFSRPVDISRFALIYAGAQKNMGPAGTTLVIVKEDELGKVNRNIPSMLDYRTHIAKNSTFNTPPVFPIYVSMLTLRWIKSLGGLKAMEARNQEKAALMYAEIDRNALFKGTAAEEDRSEMNATFVMNQPELEAEFLQVAKDAGCVGIKGHRSVGGFRASIYNAMPKEGVETLISVMRDFEQQKG